MEEVMKSEMREAVEAGEKVLITLKAAQKELNSAGCRNSDGSSCRSGRVFKICRFFL